MYPAPLRKEDLRLAVAVWQAFEGRAELCRGAFSEYMCFCLISCFFLFYLGFAPYCWPLCNRKIRNGRTDGRMDGWTDGRTDVRTDGGTWDYHRALGPQYTSLRLHAFVSKDCSRKKPLCVTNKKSCGLKSSKPINESS